MTDASERKAQPTFEAALEGLEDIVGRLEDGSLGLDESLAEFEQGMQLLKRCHGLLERAEQKIEVLTSVTADGQERTRPVQSQDSTGVSSAPTADRQAPPESDAKSLF